MPSATDRILSSSLRLISFTDATRRTKINALRPLRQAPESESTSASIFGCGTGAPKAVTVRSDIMRFTSATSMPSRSQHQVASAPAPTSSKLPDSSPACFSRVVSRKLSNDASMPIWKDVLKRYVAPSNSAHLLLHQRHDELLLLGLFNRDRLVVHVGRHPAATRAGTGSSCCSTPQTLILSVTRRMRNFSVIVSFCPSSLRTLPHRVSRLSLPAPEDIQLVP